MPSVKNEETWTPDLVIDTATELWRGMRDMAREQKQTQAREPGYYWARWNSPHRSGEWRIVEWRGGMWSPSCSKDDNVFVEVGPRILPPDHAPTRLAETVALSLLDRISQHAMLILELSALAADGGGERRQGVGGGEAAESDIDQATRRAPITTGPGLEFVTNVHNSVARNSLQRAPLGTSTGEPQAIGGHTAEQYKADGYVGVYAPPLGTVASVWAAWATDSHRSKSVWPGDE